MTRWLELHAIAYMVRRLGSSNPLFDLSDALASRHGTLLDLIQPESCIVPCRVRSGRPLLQAVRKSIRHPPRGLPRQQRLARGGVHQEERGATGVNMAMTMMSATTVTVIVL